MRTVTLIMIVLSLAAPMPAEADRIPGGLQIGIGIGDNLGGSSAPEPRLLSPISEVVDMTGLDVVEFKWSPFEGKFHRRKSYEFRLYKGYEQYEKNEVYRKTVPPSECAVTLEADLFQDGQVYTWAVRQVYYSDKSDWAFSSFRVTRKDKKG